MIRPRRHCARPTVHALCAIIIALAIGAPSSYAFQKGRTLRYRYAPGRELTYTTKATITVASESTDEGARIPAELTTSFRIVPKSSGAKEVSFVEASGPFTLGVRVGQGAEHDTTVTLPEFSNRESLVSMTPLGQQQTRTALDSVSVTEEQGQSEAWLTAVTLALHYERILFFVLPEQAVAAGDEWDFTSADTLRDTTGGMRQIQTTRLDLHFRYERDADTLGRACSVIAFDGVRTIDLRASNVQLDLGRGQSLDSMDQQVGRTTSIGGRLWFAVAEGSVAAIMNTVKTTDTNSFTGQGQNISVPAQITTIHATTSVRP